MLQTFIANRSIYNLEYILYDRNKNTVEPQLFKVMTGRKAFEKLKTRLNCQRHEYIASCLVEVIYYTPAVLMSYNLFYKSFWIYNFRFLPQILRIVIYPTTLPKIVISLSNPRT